MIFLEQQFWCFLRKNPRLKTFIYIYLLLKASKGASFLLKFLRQFIQQQLPLPKSLINSHGQASWVLITGGSSGIGRQYAIQFAKLGFNIIIISNQQLELNETKAAIFQANNKVQSVALYVDFSEILTNNQLQIDLASKLKNYDISILVNNVGMNYTKFYKDVDKNIIPKILTINLYTPLIMTKLVLNQLLERKQQSSIINMSSVTCKIPFPSVCLYVATKSAIDLFSRSLRSELVNSNVHVMSVRPWAVQTALIKNNSGLIIFSLNIINEQGLGVISAESCVQNVIQDLYQKKIVTYGHWLHFLIAEMVEMLNTLNEDILQRIIRFSYEFLVLKLRVLDF